ncbi:hypothetical protein L596_005418 [Steinernema carpocapsae]|uniref:Uncharacterized protein n=1 Tax=Steinernema carpocapsae TaxID=34508 RepID=A0A4U8V0J0_STECR|nr:hypothetical protein L596_005418 [Steinernema carpocapsae]
MAFLSFSTTPAAENLKSKEYKRLGLELAWVAVATRAEVQNTLQLVAVNTEVVKDGGATVPCWQQQQQPRTSPGRGPNIFQFWSGGRQLGRC